MRTLYAKFAVVTVLIMMGSFLLSFIGSNLYYQQKLKPLNDGKNTAVALGIAQFAKDHPELTLESYFESVAALGYQLYTVSGDGSGAYYGSPFREALLPEGALATVLQGEIYHGMRDYPESTFVTGFFANELRNTIGVPVERDGATYALFMRPDIKKLFNEMHVLFAVLFGCTVFLSVVFVLAGTKYLVKPLGRLTAATEQVASGHYDVKLDRGRKDEIGKLASSFSRMAERLGHEEEMRKEFISNVSHDIQSPLSLIKGYSGLLGKEELSQEDKQHYIGVVHDEIERLSSLTKQLLLLQSISDTRRLMRPEPFDIGKQIRTIVRQHRWRMMEREITLGCAVPDTVIQGDSNLLYTVFENLLTNAIKYNKKGGSIDIELRDSGSEIEISVSDTGIGMSQEQLPRIFERFYRGDSSRTQSVPGSGLGLSIVQSALSMHGGSIRATSEPGKGSRFTVALPKELAKE
ncbi:sensor histidine kinase [Paenibacillus sp. CAU 1782]